MWRLRNGEAENDPYLFSTNNFLGRLVWEFDRNAGNEEEKAEVEEARQNFYQNRFKYKPSADLLWRIQ
ncbi:Terpenoid cyclases/protein prenyltransferase alpha-alpha toroid, partial [Corchorus capsularis]